jgi:hypothetical protein
MRASMSIMPHRSRSESVGYIDRKMRASVSIMPHRLRSLSVGIDHWASATSIVKCFHPCQSYLVVRNEWASIDHVDREMRACVAIIDCKARSLCRSLMVKRGHLCRSLSNSRIDRESVCIIIGHLASAKSIVKRACRYQSSGISQKCTFVFLANILATFFPGMLAYIPKLGYGARAAPSRPRRPRRNADVLGWDDWRRSSKAWWQTNFLSDSFSDAFITS